MKKNYKFQKQVPDKNDNNDKKHWLVKVFYNLNLINKNLRCFNNSSINPALKFSGILFILFFILTFKDLKSLEAKEKLIFSTVRTSPVTITVEKVLKEAYGKIKIEFDVINLPGKRALNLSNSGETDGEMLRIKNIDKEYKNLIIIPVPVYIMEGSAAVENGKLPKWTIENMKPYRIGIVRGILWSKKVTKGMNVIVVNDYDTLLKIMKHRKIDIILGENMGLKMRLSKYNFKNIKIAEPPIVKIKLYHYLNKKHSSLVPEITNVLRKMQENNRIEKIREGALSTF